MFPSRELLKLYCLYVTKSKFFMNYFYALFHAFRETFLVAIKK